MYEYMLVDYYEFIFGINTNEQFSSLWSEWKSTAGDSNLIENDKYVERVVVLCLVYWNFNRLRFSFKFIFLDLFWSGKNLRMSRKRHKKRTNVKKFEPRWELLNREKETIASLNDSKYLESRIKNLDKKNFTSKCVKVEDESNEISERFRYFLFIIKMIKYQFTHDVKFGKCVII